MYNGSLIAMKTCLVVGMLICLKRVGGILPEAMEVEDMNRAHVLSNFATSSGQGKHLQPSYSMDPEGIKNEFKAVSDYYMDVDMRSIHQSVERVKNVAQTALDYWREMERKEQAIAETLESGRLPDSNRGFDPEYVSKCKQVYEKMKKAHPTLGREVPFSSRKRRYSKVRTTDEALNMFWSSIKRRYIEYDSVRTSEEISSAKAASRYRHIQGNPHERRIKQFLHRIIDYDFQDVLFVPKWFNHLHEWVIPEKYIDRETHFMRSSQYAEELYQIRRMNEDLVRMIPTELTSLLSYRNSLPSENLHELFTHLNLGRPEDVKPMIMSLKDIPEDYDEDIQMMNFRKMPIAFNRIVVEIKSIEGMLDHATKNKYHLPINEHIHQWLQDLLDQCFEVSIKFEVEKRRALFEKIKLLKNTVTEVSEDTNLVEKNNHDIGTDLYSNQVVDLLTGLKRCLQYIPFEKMDPYPVLTENLNKNQQQLGLSWRIALEKSIFGQIQYLYKFNIIKEDQVNDFFSDNETLQLLGKHVHNRYQDSESQAFKPSAKFLFHNPQLPTVYHKVVASSLTTGMPPKSKMVIVYQVLTSTYRSLERFCQAYNSPMEIEFTRLMENFGKNSFLNELSKNFDQRSVSEDSVIPKFIKNSKSYLEKPFNGYTIPCTGSEEASKVPWDEATGVYGLFGKLEHNRVAIQYATQETQWLLNFYVMKFYEEFFKEDLQKVLPKNGSLLNFSIKMQDLEAYIDSNQMQLRFFEYKRGTCNLPLTRRYSNVEN